MAKPSRAGGGKGSGTVDSTEKLGRVDDRKNPKPDPPNQGEGSGGRRAPIFNPCDTH